MTIPELPDHPRFRMFNDRAEFCTFFVPNSFVADWSDIELLPPYQIESCVAIARCWFEDHAKKIMDEGDDTDATWILWNTAMTSAHHWKLYGESRK